MRRCLTAGLLGLTLALAFVGFGGVSSAAYPAQVVTSTFVFGSSASTSLGQMQLVFNGPFTVVSTTGTNLQCEFWTFNFTAATGQYLSGNFTSDNPVSFYVIQAASYRTWQQVGSCGNAGDAIASQLLVTSYSFNVAIPSTGPWLIVFVNASNAKNAGGFLTAILSTEGYTVTQVMMTTMTTNLAYSGASANGQITTIPGFPIASIIIGILIGLVAITLLRRRKSKERT